MRLTREDIVEMRSYNPNEEGPLTPTGLATWQAICDLALLGLAQEQNNTAPSIHVGTATTDLSQPRTWNGENVQVYVPAAPDAAAVPQGISFESRTLSGEDHGGSATPAAAAPVDRIAELEAKIARMRPSEEAVEDAKFVLDNRDLFPNQRSADMARELLRIDEEAK